jgi:heme exporter protein D
MGLVSSALFLLTWFGLWSQIKSMNKYQYLCRDANNSLSLNQFGSSYFAFFSLFLFGISVEPFNHYLVWTRFGALLLTLVIIMKIWQQRRGPVTTMVTSMATLVFLAGIASMFFRPFPAIAQLGTATLMLGVTVILFQGTLHQLLVLKRRQKVGSLSATLFKNILIKDVSTLLFGLTMPLSQSWPLLVLNGTSVIMRGAVLVEILRLKRREEHGVIDVSN